MIDEPPRPPDETPEPEGAPKRNYPGWYERITGVGTSAGKAILIPTLALLTALIIGMFIIALTDLDSLRLWGSDPGKAFTDTVDGIWVAYRALLTGSVGSVNAISETLFAATPLILAGLAVAVGFRAGLFNIGANGQMLIGGICALWVGIYVSLPLFLHIPLALVAAILGGAIWGSIAGFLKARTGAHEVITTIMLNFIALFLVEWLLKTTTFIEPGRNNPVSQPVRDTAQFPEILGSSYRVHIGFLIAVGAVFFVNWLLFRTSIGYEFRAAGFNPDAAKYAGMSVAFIYVLVMAVSGGLAGIAGANQILGLAPYVATPLFVGTVGFDAIALALLGRSHPFGVFWAGLLFGALRAGGRVMQGQAQIPVDLVVVIQALIIVLIAAPEIIRAIYRVSPYEEESRQLTKGWG